MEENAEKDEFIREYDAFVRGIVRHTRAQLGVESSVEDLVAFALDVVVMALWQHRRIHGELPELVSRFADLLEPAMFSSRG